jgi:peptidoglycan/LPS O-acetylase OafA/YrhL
MKIEYPNLDLLRAVAVLLVVACHVLTFYGVTGTFGAWGMLGVCIFFVHTSLVLIQSIAHREPGPLFIPFMIRRSFRIYPLAIVLILLVVLFRAPQAAIAAGHLTSWSYDWIDVVVNLALVQGLTAAGKASIIGPLWSLSYEMQMYALLPLIFLFVNRKRRALRLAALYAGVLAVSLVVCRYFPLTTIFSFAPCFAAGIVSYYLLQAHRPRLAAWGWPALLAAMCVGFALGWIPVGWWTVCAVLALATPAFRQITYQPLVAAAKIVARYSYGIYVAHYLCIYVALEKLPGPTWLRLGAFVALLAVVTVALYHLVEEPCILAGKRAASCYVKEKTAGRRAAPLTVAAVVLR